MQLVRTRPAVAAPLSDVERLFDSFFSGSRAAAVARPWAPAVDVAENEEAIVLTADLPGLSEDEIAIEVDDGVLTVSGERRDSRTDKEAGYRRVERSFGRFSRALRLPRGTDPEAISASFDLSLIHI